MSRDPLLDWLKGLAILLMVYGHVVPVGTWAAEQSAVVDFIYTFHMPLFLVISGYLFPFDDDPAQRGKALLDRLLRPYLIFITLYLIGLVLISYVGIPTQNPPPTSFADYLKIITLQPRGAYWFLHSLMVVQGAFIVPTLAARATKSDAGTSVLIALAILALLASVEFVAARTATYFMLGMVLRSTGLGLPSGPLMGALVLAAILIFGFQHIYPFTLVQVAWCLGVMACLAGLGRMVAGTVPFALLTWVGRNTILVLVLHAAFVVALKPVAPLVLKVEPTGILYSLLVALLTAAGTLFAGAVIDRLRLAPLLFGNATIYRPFRAPPLEPRAAAEAA